MASAPSFQPYRRPPAPLDDGPAAVVSALARELAGRRPSVRADALRVLRELRFKSNNARGASYCREVHVADVLGRSVTTIERIVRLLREHGAIVVRRPDRRRANRITVVVDPGELERAVLALLRPPRRRKRTVRELTGRTREKSPYVPTEPPELRSVVSAGSFPNTTAVAETRREAPRGVGVDPAEAAYPAWMRRRTIAGLVARSGVDAGTAEDFVAARFGEVRRVVALLEELGVRRQQAPILVRTFGLEECRQQVAWLPYRRGVRDVGAYLAAAIRSGLPEPAVLAMVVPVAGGAGPVEPAAAAARAAAEAIRRDRAARDEAAAARRAAQEEAVARWVATAEAAIAALSSRRLRVLGERAAEEVRARFPRLSSGELPPWARALVRSALRALVAGPAPAEC